MGMAPLQKLYLWIKSTNSWVGDKTTMSYLVMLAQEFHLSFGLMESQHQDYLVKYCGFISWPWVLAVIFPVYIYSKPATARLHGALHETKFRRMFDFIYLYTVP